MGCKEMNIIIQTVHERLNLNFKPDSKYILFNRQEKNRPKLSIEYRVKRLFGIPVGRELYICSEPYKLPKSLR